MNDFDGVFPRTREEVLSLRGIGDYTAAAICSFAYRLPYATVDGNVFRVLARLFDIDLSIDEKGRNTLRHWPNPCWMNVVRICSTRR